MKTRKPIFLALSAFLLAAAVLSALGLASWATAAPGAAPGQSIPGAAMAALADASSCTLDESVTPNVRTCHLWALPGAISLPGSSSPLPIWGFTDVDPGVDPAAAGVMPGPVVRANQGETLAIVLHNELGENLSLAFPGQDGAPDLEGAAPGETKTYTLENMQPGTFLYEAGRTPNGGRQVSMGLFGPLVVSGAAPVWDQEIVLVFNEVDPAFHADPVNFSMIKYTPKYWLINGRAFPDTGWIETSPGSTVLLRYLNAGGEHHAIGLLGLNQQVRSVDGEALPFPYGAVVEPLAPGETKEALVSVPADAIDGTLFPLYDGSLMQHNNNQRLADARAAFGGMLTFLRASDGGTPANRGPVVSGLSAAPQRADGTEDVVLQATLSDDTEVVAYETYVDVVGAPDTNPVAVSPAVSVDVQVVFPASEVAAWSTGTHTLYLRGRDNEGVWGPLGSTVITVDMVGPAITGLGLNPDPTNGLGDVALSGTADDRGAGGGLVAAAEYQVAGAGWQPMTVSPLNASVAGLSAAIPAASLPVEDGRYVVEVRAQDDLGNWSAAPGAAELVLDKTGPNVIAANLSQDVVDLNQPLPPSIRLTAALEDPLVGGVQTPLVRVEAFISVLGDPGTGFPIYPEDGLFDEISENAYFDIPITEFAMLAEGEHQVYVMGKDQAGNWGPAGAAVITIVPEIIDTTGPALSGVAASPNPTARAKTVTLSAAAADGQTPIVRAVWFLGTDPAGAALNEMSAADGAFDSLSEELTAAINVNKWKFDTYQISVRALDAAGNWGEIVTIDLVVSNR